MREASNSWVTNGTESAGPVITEGTGMPSQTTLALLVEQVVWIEIANHRKQRSNTWVSSRLKVHRSPTAHKSKERIQEGEGKKRAKESTGSNGLKDTKSAGESDGVSEGLSYVLNCKPRKRMSVCIILYSQ